MPILKDLSEGALAAAVEANQVEWIRMQGRLPWVKWHDDGDAVWVFAGDTWPRNMVGQARFKPEAAHRRVGEILAVHLRHKVACDWVVGPVSQPPNLSQALKAHGFSCRIHCAGMACRLDARQEKPQLPPAVEIRETVEPATIYPLTTQRRRALHQGLTLMAEFRPRTIWHFSAHIDGQAVGRSLLQLRAGVAGIYGVGVMENHRRKGVGTALVHAALEQARALGYKAAVLGATGMGQGVYERLGFREVCKLSFWKYGKMRQL